MLKESNVTNGERLSKYYRTRHETRSCVFAPTLSPKGLFHTCVQSNIVTRSKAGVFDQISGLPHLATYYTHEHFASYLSSLTTFSIP